MKKTTSAKSKPVTTGKSERIDVNKNTSANIRQIENGYIVSESGYTGKGKNQQWFNREYFTPTNPVASAKVPLKITGKK